MRQGGRPKPERATEVVDLLPDIIVRCLVVIDIPKLFDLFCNPLHTGEFFWVLLPIGLWDPEYCREQVAGVEVAFGEGVLLQLGKREGRSTITPSCCNNRRRRSSTCMVPIGFRRSW